MPKLCVALIAKNEAPTIAQTLESAVQVFGDVPVVVLDTGSTDGTIDAVQSWARDTELPHRDVVVMARAFDDFASSRNACLGWAFNFGERVAMVDCGMVVRGQVSLPPGALPGKVTFHLGSLRYERVMIMPQGWNFVGKVHEYNTGPGIDHAVDTGVVYDYCLRESMGAKGRRWLRDLALLEEDMSPRGRYYYAQTLHCLGRNTQALKAYLERYLIKDEGFWQERVMAMLNAIPLAENRDDAERYARLALELDPSRGEAWLHLCKWAEDAGHWLRVYQCATEAIKCVPRTGALFIDSDREWKANRYAGDAASNRGDFATARWHWARALDLAGDRMPADDREELTLALSVGGSS